MGESTAVERLLTPEEYLAGELTADVRSEYVGGRTYPMPGVSAVHDRLCRNLDFALESVLRDHPCQVHGPDLKLRSLHGHVYYYPDLMVCCDPEDSATYWRDRPSYVFEITSPDTRRTDAGEKKLAYFRIVSIEAYVQVAQDAVYVIVNRRVPGLDYWQEEAVITPDEHLRLDGLGFSLPLSEIYRRTGLLDTA